MTNRILVGRVRYGPADRSKKYFTRLKLEAAAYAKTGNAEHLLNIANYAYLESTAPEHVNFHHDNKAASVTRGKGLE